MSVSAIFLFLVILLVLVIVHEFGHFIVAKWVGMRVDEFAFGFPPRIFGKKIGETLYAINLLPLGGYVSIWGENGSDEDKKENGAAHHPRAFGNRPWWAQMLVLVAGVAMNMALALFIFIFISYGTIEISTSDQTYGSRVKNAQLMIVDSSVDSPAYKAGIVPGSILLDVKARNATASLVSTTSLVSFIESHQNDPFLITYKKPDGVIASTTIAAVYGIVPEKKVLGIALDSVGTVKTTALEAIKIGAFRTYNITQLTLEGLGGLVTSLFKGESVMESLSGPVGIAKIVNQTSDYGYAAVLTLVAILSINLAIFNILPFPALDGGRMIVVLIEAVGRRKIPFKYYSWTNAVGFSLLMLLLIVVTIHDIGR